MLIYIKQESIRCWRVIPYKHTVEPIAQICLPALSFQSGNHQHKFKTKTELAIWHEPDWPGTCTTMGQERSVREWRVQWLPRWRISGWETQSNRPLQTREGPTTVGVNEQGTLSEQIH